MCDDSDDNVCDYELSENQRLFVADAEAQDPDIWSDQDRARQVMSRRAQLQQQVSSAEALVEACEKKSQLSQEATKSVSYMC